MTPYEFSGPIPIQTTLYWLVTGIRDTIDLNRMSTGSRRDFPEGVSGSHMAGDRQTPFREVKFDIPPPNTYLLKFDASLTAGDYRANPDPNFEEQLYGISQNFSQQVFIRNSGEFKKLGVNSIIRHSAPSKAEGIIADVYGILPEARESLRLQSIEPIGPDSPPIKIRLFNNSGEFLTSDFYLPHGGASNIEHS